MFNLLLIVYTIRSTVSVVADDKSPWQFYVLNPFLGYGTLGKFFNGIYICGLPMCVAHGLTVFWFEWKAKLTPLTDLRTMYRKLGQTTNEEEKQFTFFLQTMPFIASLGFLGVSVPMSLVRVFYQTILCMA